MTDEQETRVLIYIGKYQLKSGKLVHAFEPEDNPHGIRYWEKAKSIWFAGAKIGYKYRIGKTLNSQTIWSNIECGKVDEDRRLRMQVESQMEQLAHRQKSVDASPDLKYALDLLRQARRKTPLNRLSLFDAWLLNEVRKER